MTRIKDIAAILENAAPLALQAGFDNSGLVVGDREAEVRSALLCVDATEEVMDEAERLGVGMVISHHPIIFHPLRELTGRNHVQRVVERAIRGGIALYGCHTNLDSAPGGLSHRLAAMLGLQNTRVLEPHEGPYPDAGYGVVGELPRAVAAGEFLAGLKKQLNAKVVRHSDLCHETVSRIAVCSGSAAGQIGSALAAGAEVFVAADLKYNHFLDAAGEIILADVGHFESEYCAIEVLFDIISKILPTFALYKSAASRNPVNYLI